MSGALDLKETQPIRKNLTEFVTMKLLTVDGALHLIFEVGITELEVGCWGRTLRLELPHQSHSLPACD